MYYTPLRRAKIFLKKKKNWGFTLQDFIKTVTMK